MTNPETIRDLYTRKVSGDTFTYEAEYTPGEQVVWRARVYQDGDLKGTPSGQVADNTLVGEDLRRYIIGTIENLIERGLGIEE